MSETTWAPTGSVDTRERQEIILEHVGNLLADKPSQLPAGLIPTSEEIDQAIIKLRDLGANGWNSSPMGPRVCKIGL